MNKLAIAASLALAAGTLLAVGWWLGQQQLPAAASLARDASRGGVDAERTDAEDLGFDARISAPPELDLPASDASASAAAANPLPALDTPVDLIFDDLAERARRGDARAACRLAVELQRCRVAGFAGRGTRWLESRAAREDDGERREAMISELARAENERERSETVCSGLESSQLDQAFAYQQQAAQAMPELRTWAATQPALNFMNFVNELEAWQQYRSVAIPWLESAAREGDFAALAALARVYAQRDPRQMRLPPVSQPDAERFALYAGLLERRGLSFGPLQAELERARSELEPAALARVQNDIDQLATRLPNTPAPQGSALRRALGAATPDPDVCE